MILPLSLYDQLYISIKRQVGNTTVTLLMSSLSVLPLAKETANIIIYVVLEKSRNGEMYISKHHTKNSISQQTNNNHKNTLFNEIYLFFLIRVTAHEK